MRNRLSIILSVVFITAFATMANACGCTFYPFEGTYGSGSEQFSLQYSGQSGGELPSALILKAKRRGGGLPDALVALTCKGDGWAGIETTPIGQFHWIIDGVRDSYNFDVPAKFSNLFASAVVFSKNIKLTIIVPPMPLVPNSHTRHGIPQAQSGASAPSAICNQINDIITSNNEFIAAYSDQAILDYATNNNLRVHDKTAALYMEGNALKKFKGLPLQPYTHEDLVNAKVDNRLNLSASPPVSAVPAGGSSVSIAAETASDTCDISFNTQQAGANSCNTYPDLMGSLKHEQAHQALCKSKNSVTSVVSPSGQTRVTNGQNNYASFSEWPENSIADEKEAYAADNVFQTRQLQDYGCPPYTPPRTQ